MMKGNNTDYNCSDLISGNEKCLPKFLRFPRVQIGPFLVSRQDFAYSFLPPSFTFYYFNNVFSMSIIVGNIGKLFDSSALRVLIVDQFLN